MPSFDAILGILAFIVPPILVATMSRRRLAFLVGTLWVWGLMVAAGEYNLATDPEYDSIAPGVSIVFGWVIGAMYTGIWLGAFTLAGMAVGETRRSKARREREQ